MLLDVKRRRTIEVETNIEINEMREKKIIKIKERSIFTLLKRKQKMSLMTMMINL